MLGKEGGFYGMFRKKDKDYLPQKKTNAETDAEEEIVRNKLEAPDLPVMIGDGEDLSKKMGPVSVVRESQAEFASENLSDKKTETDEFPAPKEELSPSEIARQNMRNLAKNLAQEKQTEDHSAEFRASEKKSPDFESAGQAAWDLGPQLASLIAQNSQIGAEIDRFKKGDLSEAEVQALRDKVNQLFHDSQKAQRNIEVIYKKIAL